MSPLITVILNNALNRKIKSKDGKIVRFRNVINIGLGAWTCFRKTMDLFSKTSKRDDIEQFPITVMGRYS